MSQENPTVTIDAGGVADVLIEGTWQTLRLRSSVEQDPDDSSLTLITDKGEILTIDCGVMERALPFFERFGRTGRLHEVVDDAPGQDPLIAAAFLVGTTMRKDEVIVSDVDGHKGAYALSAASRVVRLYGETEMPFDGTMEDMLAIVNDGAFYTRRR